MFLRCSTFAVSTFCLFTGFPALTQVVPAPKRCASVTSAELAAMQQYLTAKFRLSAPPEISIAEVQQDCFTRLTVSLQGVGHQERRVPLYLAPDHRYLFPDVFDLEISPQVAERREAKRLKHLVIPGSHPIVGSASSPVQIVVYSDFGCPHCATLWRTLKPYVENRAGAIAMAFRSCPIDQLHPWAEVPPSPANARRSKVQTISFRYQTSYSKGKGILPQRIWRLYCLNTCASNPAFAWTHLNAASSRERLRQTSLRTNDPRVRRVSLQFQLSSSMDEEFREQRRLRGSRQ